MQGFVGRLSETIKRPIKVAWFDALVFDPRFGAQNCLSVVQALQAEFGNLMAVRQNLCVQIGDSACVWLTQGESIEQPPTPAYATKNQI